jgi:predicted SAM-dependent methyltransferase
MSGFQAFNSEGKPILLHVGAGSSTPDKLPKVFKDYHEVRLDIDPRCKPDIVSSMTRMKLVDDNSVDAIWCSHALEHLANHEVQPTLREWRRVLKDDGFALMTMPDLMQAAKMIADGRLMETIYESPIGPITPLDMVFGHSVAIERGYINMQHRTGFTLSRLKQELHAANFVHVIGKCDGINLFVQAQKKLTDKSRNIMMQVF